jgi:hypothetical protein
MALIKDVKKIKMLCFANKILGISLRTEKIISQPIEYFYNSIKACNYIGNQKFFAMQNTA